MPFVSTLKHGINDEHNIRTQQIKIMLYIRKMLSIATKKQENTTKKIKCYIVENLASTIPTNPMFSSQYLILLDEKEFVRNSL